MKMKKILFSKSFIKLAILTVLHAAYAGFVFYEYIAVLIGIAFTGTSAMGTSAAVFSAAAFVCALIPALMGLLLVDRPKWWLVSLPAQLMFGTAVQWLCWKYLNPDELRIRDPGIGALIWSTLFFLTLQAVGVGIKALWLKLKAKNSPKT